MLTDMSPGKGCFLLLLGRLADVYGRRRGFLLGIAWFAGWAIACGFAQTPVQLALFRAFQGIGVAAIIPAAVRRSLNRKEEIES